LVVGSFRHLPFNQRGHRLFKCAKEILRYLQPNKLREHAPNAKYFAQKKGSRHHQLSEAEQSANRHKSKTRSRVEHVFGVMKRQFHRGQEEPIVQIRLYVLH
jgi:hypothetical protein